MAVAPFLNKRAPCDPRRLASPRYSAAPDKITERKNLAPPKPPLAGARALVRDAAGIERAAPLFFVSPTQANLLVPPETTLGVATVRAVLNNEFVSCGSVLITNVVPGLFTANTDGQGAAAAVALRVRGAEQTVEPVLRFDQASNRFVAVPIHLGPEGDQVFLIAFGTGFRARSALAAVTALVGGVHAPVLFAGAQGQLVGLDQVNLSLPRSLSGSGEVEVRLIVDGLSANPVRIHIR